MDSAMTGEALLAINDSAPCPIGVDKLENGGIRLDWGTKDALDFVVLSERQADELIDKLLRLTDDD